MRRGRRSSRAGWVALLVALVVWSLRGAGIHPSQLATGAARHNVGAFLGGFAHPDLSRTYLREVVSASLQTVQIAVAGMVVGALLAAPLAYLAAETLSPSAGPGLDRRRRLLRALPYHAARSLLDVLRGIPELLWALIFITAVGLGPFAGALAIGVHAGGLLGKLWAEQLEGVDPAPIEAVRLLGAGRWTLASVGVLPQARHNLVSLGLYQGECNLRAATIVGFVGAGGIGQDIDVSLRLFRYSETATLILAVLLLVLLADRASALIRRRLR